MLHAALPRVRIPHRALLLVVLFGCFAAHVVEIVIYAAAYWLLADRLGLGGFGGAFAGTPDSYLYFSAETYTSLGFGDIYPTGSLRLLAGFETLNGLLLIAWSASFTYLAMEKFWGGTQRGG